MSKASAEEKHKVFCRLKKEEQLLGPISTWLSSKKLAVHDEVPMGQSRVDVLGYAKGSFWSAERVVAVELKNTIGQLRRGLDQMTNYIDYAHQVYLACTPALAAAYLKSHLNAPEVRHWDARALERKLKKFKIGLLLVENTQVYEVTPSSDFSPDGTHLEQVRCVVGR